MGGDRMADAAEEMGITVFGGAIPSIGASSMLFLCYFQNFLKFGAFMCLTIVLSWAWSMLFFLPAMAIAGPQGKCCSFHRPSSKSGATTAWSRNAHESEMVNR